MKMDAVKFLREVTLEDRLAEPQNWAQRAAALLSGVVDADHRADLRGVFEERAAICEYDGGMPRDEAERLAYERLQAILATQGAV